MYLIHQHDNICVRLFVVLGSSTSHSVYLQFSTEQFSTEQ